MKRFRLLGLVLVAVLVFASLQSTLAFAGLPEFLAAGGNTTFTSKITSPVFFRGSTGNTILCSSGATGSGGFTSDFGGTFHISFTGCNSPSFFNAPCKSKSDATEEVLMLGSFSHVYDALGAGETLGVVLLLQPTLTEVECTGIAVSIIKGNFACLLTKALTSSVTHVFECLKGAKAGEQKVKSYYNDNGTLVSTQLLISLNGGSFEPADVEFGGTVTTPTVGAFMNE